MGATTSSNVNFVPKVWNDHIQAYFDRKMGLGQLAVLDKTLEASPGETVSFPFWKAIGDAQEPAENEGLEVEPLVDDSFSCTVKEVGKAVGWKDKAKRKSAAGKAEWEKEGQTQMARVLAEKVDKDIITLINTSGNYVDGFTAASASDKMTISSMLDLKIGSFGDKQNQAIAIAMHALSFSTLMKDSAAGFLKADATDPLFGSPGFEGRYLGQALFVLDSMPRGTDVGGKKAYYAFTFKANPFGIYMAQELNPEMDRDILHRETILAATMWYGLCGLHSKVATNDYRVGRGLFATDSNA